MDYWKKVRQAVGDGTLIISGAAGAISKEGKILLVRHNTLKKWQIPGGTQEIGESIQQTIQREIKEELNLDLVARSLISVYSDPKWNIEFPNGDIIQQLTCFFLMEGINSPIRINTSEIAAYRFFDPTEIPDETMECCKQKVSDWVQFQSEVKLR